MDKPTGLNYGWSVIGAGVFFQAVMYGLTLFSFIFWAPIWAREFEANLADVMWANVGMMIVQGLFSPFVGYAMERYSIKVMICVGAVVSAVGFLLLSVANSIWHIVLIYCTLIPLGMVLAGPLAAQTLTARWFDQKRGLAMGVSTTGTSIGGIVLPVAVGLFFFEFGWRDTHLVLAGMVLTIVPIVLSLVIDSPSKIDSVVRHDRDDFNLKANDREWSTRMILVERNFWVIVVAFLPLIAAQSAIQSNLAVLAIELGTESGTTPLLISIMSVAMIIGKVAFGRQADYWDHRLLFFIACLITAAVILFIFTKPGFSGQILMVGVLGFGNGAILPLLGAMISARFGASGYGRVMGLLGPFLLLSALGSVIVASSYDRTGSFALAFAVLLVLIVPAALVIMWLESCPKQTTA
ncbi:MAG: MFS transporter [Pseudomonadota bacterium]